MRCLVARLAGMLQFVALNATTKYVTTVRMKDDAAHVKSSFAVNAKSLFAVLAVGVTIAIIASRRGMTANALKTAALSATRVEM